jgi:hypothetical protein
MVLFHFLANPESSLDGSLVDAVSNEIRMGYVTFGSVIWNRLGSPFKCM